MYYYLKLLFISLVLFCSIGTTPLYAQQLKNQVEVSYSNSAKKGTERYFYELEFIGQIGEYVYAYCVPGVELRINAVGGPQQYQLLKIKAQNLNDQQFEFLELSIGSKKKQFEQMFIVQGKIYLVSSFQNQTDRKFYYFIETINPETMKFNDDAKKIQETSYADEHKYNLTDVQVSLSMDTSKVLLIFPLYDNQDVLLKEKIIVLDEQMNKIWDNVSEKMNNDEYYIQQSSKVGNSGFVATLNIAFKSKAELITYKNSNYYVRNSKTARKSNYRYTITYNSNEQKTIREIDITLDDFFVRECNFALIKDEIIAFGLYSSKDDRLVKGNFLNRYNRFTGKLISSNKKTIDATNIISEDWPKAMKKKRYNLYYYDSPLLLTDNGEYIFSFEQASRVPEKIALSGYYFSNILSARYSKDGKPIWSETIKKNQLITPIMSHFQALVHNNHFYVLYTEITKKNINNMTGFVKDYQLKLSSIDPSGKMEEFTFANGKELDMYLYPGITLVNNNCMYGYGEKGLANNRYQFMQLKIK